MTLAEAKIDVHPPRAGRFAKSARRVLPVRAVSSSVLHPAGVVTHKLLGAIPFLTYLIPGGAQFHTRNRVAGRIFLFSYLALAFLGLLFYGSFWGGTFLGLLFSVHLASVTLAADPAAGDIFWRLGRAALYGFLLFVVVYLPIGIGASYVIDAAVVAGDAAPLETGDVLLVHHLRAPGRGDIVRYNIPYRQYATANHNYYYFGGPQIDRILAVAGDTLEIRNGVVFVNGKLSGDLPLRQQRVMDLAAVRVPVGSLVILPTATLQAPAHIADKAWRDICVVPGDGTNGIVYWRHQPLTRWGPLP